VRVCRVDAVPQPAQGAAPLNISAPASRKIERPIEQLDVRPRIGECEWSAGGARRRDVRRVVVRRPIGRWNRVTNAGELRFGAGETGRGDWPEKRGGTQLVAEFADASAQHAAGWKADSADAVRAGIP